MVMMVEVEVLVTVVVVTGFVFVSLFAEGRSGGGVEKWDGKDVI